MKKVGRGEKEKRGRQRRRRGDERENSLVCSVIFETPIGPFSGKERLYVKWENVGKQVRGYVFVENSPKSLF